MAEYTYKDVIIDPEDPRVEIGKEYYFGDNPGEVLKWANSNHETHRLRMILKENYPFSFEGLHFPCIIRKKEPEKKYVPFDLSFEEDRAKLRGAWVRIKGSQLEHQIVGLAANTQIVFIPDVVGVEAKELLEGYEFIDGSPCGKLVEEEE